MSEEPKMTNAMQSAFTAIADRHTKQMAELIAAHPEYRRSIAYGILGNAIAFCDTFGADADEFIRKLRMKEPRPSQLVPPKRRQS